MPDGVVDQVGQRPAQLAPASARHHHRRARRDGDRHPRPAYAVRHLGRAAPDRPPGRRAGGPGVGVGAGEQQQVLDQRRTAGPGRPAGRRQRAALAEPLGHLELGPHAGQRAAQLVGGVGDERALPLPAGGQPVEHPVQGDGQGTDLVGGRRHRQPASSPRRPARQRRAGRADRSAPARSSSTGRSVQPITRQAIAASTAEQQREGDQQRVAQPPAGQDVAERHRRDHR